MKKDIFHIENKKLIPMQVELIKDIKEDAEVLYDKLLEIDQARIADSRMLEIAKTKLEEAVMWAVKGLT